MEAPEPEAEERRETRRGRLLVAILLALVAVAIAVSWSQRRPIAAGFVDRELARRGVAGSYRITRFGLSTQRLENIRIGDPARPDLVADWAELRLSMGLTGPRVRGISAGGVRMRGRVIEGKLSLGAIDRLLPAPSGVPFALPDLDLRLDDAAMHLDTPAGAIGLALSGRGNLTDGFRGRMAAVAHRLATGGCTLAAPRAYLEVAIADRKPSVTGPLNAGSIICAGVAAERPRLTLDLAFAEALDRWRGTIGFAVPALRGSGVALAGLSGEGSVDGSAAAMRGRVQAHSGAFRTAAASAGDGMADVGYELDFARDSQKIEGSVGAGGIAIAPDRIRPLLAALDGASGSPIGPIAQALAQASARAAQRFAVASDIILLRRGAIGGVRLRRIDLNSASGARLIASGGTGVSFFWPRGVTRVDGELALSGGGFPSIRLLSSQPRLDVAPTGSIVAEPFVAGAARLVVAPVRFEADGRGTARFVTRATLDGPLGDGRVAGLTLPLEGRIGSDGSLIANGACAPLGFDLLEIAGMRIGPSRLPLCPTGAALVSGGGRRPFAAGARIARPVLNGSVGSSPLRLAADDIDVGMTGFRARALSARLGVGEAVTRLDAAAFDGRFEHGSIGGRFAGLSGNIANVPLLVSEGAGEWRLADATLDMKGAIRVADAAPEPRFAPLRSEDMTLRLAGGDVIATGSLIEPATSTKVTEVAIAHRLSAGTGHATLTVPGLVFGEALQPEALTRLTLGVVANVRGTVSGAGRIDWTPEGVTSGGSFRTDGIDLAAAFGPVKGIKGEIRFSDLLGLQTAPGQIATIAEINPGIAVADGVVRYQLLPEFKVAVEEGRWPFSGGELLLEPTILDFSEAAERRLTFRVTGLDAAEFVQAFEFDNISVTGTFDGTVPMIFDKSGGRIEKGRLAVRQGGGTLAYVGPVSNASLGMFGKLAFDALKSMRYDRLAIELDGSLDGEIISKVLFDGTNETPKQDKPRGLLGQLTGLPFRFNITIRAPFRGLLNSAESLNDPRGLIGRSLPSRDSTPLPGSAPVQTQESEDVR